MSDCVFFFRLPVVAAAAVMAAARMEISHRKRFPHSFCRLAF